MRIIWYRSLLPLRCQPSWAWQRQRLANVSWMSRVVLALSRVMPLHGSDQQGVSSDSI